MLSLVSARVGVAGSLEKGGAGHRPRATVVLGMAGHIPPIGTGVGDGDAESGLGDVHPAMGMNLEAEGIPRGVGVGGTGDVTHLDLVVGVIGVDVHRPGQFEQTVSFVPVDMGAHLDARISRIHGQRLGSAGIPERPCDADGHGITVAGHGGPAIIQVGDVVGVEGIDVPRVPHVREVRVNLKKIATLTSRDGIATGSRVDEVGDEAVLVNGKTQQAIVDDESVSRILSLNPVGNCRSNSGPHGHGGSPRTSHRRRIEDDLLVTLSG